MLPPSDSFLHQSLKLGEVTANMQNQEPLAPPPPYSTIQLPTPVYRDIHHDTDIGIDTDDEDATWDTNPNPTPITIHIDASISVQGNGNTIIMTSGTASGAVSAPAPSTAPSPTSMFQTAQKHRQNRITEMATSIIAALQESQIISPSGANGKGRPIEINIDTGMKIEGSRNVICAGAGGGACRILPRAKRDEPSHNDDEDESSLKRKRRATSEPVENMPKTKERVVVVNAREVT